MKNQETETPANGVVDSRSLFDVPGALIPEPCPTCDGSGMQSLIGCPGAQGECRDCHGFGETDPFSDATEEQLHAHFRAHGIDPERVRKRADDLRQTLNERLAERGLTTFQSRQYAKSILRDGKEIFEGPAHDVTEWLNVGGGER